jgi:hypothetical protein
MKLKHPEVPHESAGSVLNNNSVGGGNRHHSNSQ